MSSEPKKPYEVMFSSVKDLGTKGVKEHMALTGRATFKTTKGRYEAVWPSPLEAALLHALCEYNLICGDQERYGTPKPRRNIFVSNFIFNSTNQRRTPKQVASRLQQLQKTPNLDPEVKQIIMGKPVSAAALKPFMSPARPPETSTSSTTLDSAPDSPDPPDEVPLVLAHVAWQSARYPSPPPEVHLDHLASRPSFQDICLRTVAEWKPHTHLLRGMDPTFILISTAPLQLQATFEVFRDKQSYRTAEETLRPDGLSQGRWRYYASIATNFWPSISDTRLQQNRTEWTVVYTLYSGADELPDSPPIALISFSFEAHNDRRSDAEILAAEAGDRRMLDSQNNTRVNSFRQNAVLPTSVPDGPLLVPPSLRRPESVVIPDEDEDEEEAHERRFRRIYPASAEFAG